MIIWGYKGSQGGHDDDDDSQHRPGRYARRRAPAEHPHAARAGKNGRHHGTGESLPGLLRGHARRHGVLAEGDAREPAARVIGHGQGDEHDDLADPVVLRHEQHREAGEEGQAL